MRYCPWTLAGAPVLAALAAPALASPAGDLWAALDAAEGAVTVDAGAVSEDADGLALENLVVALRAPDGRERIELAWRAARMTSAPDGSVTIRPDGEATLSGAIAGAGGQMLDLQGAMGHPDATLTVTTRPDGLRLVLDMPALQGSLTATDPSVGNGASKNNPKGGNPDVGAAEFSGDGLFFDGGFTLSGQPAGTVRTRAGRLNASVSSFDPALPFDMSVALSGWSATSDGRLNAMPPDDGSFPGGKGAIEVAFAEISVAGSGSDATTGGRFGIDYRLTDGALTLSAEADAPPPGAEMPRLAASGSMRLGESDGSFDIDDPSEPVSMQSSGESKPFSLSFALRTPPGADAMDVGQALAEGLAANLRLDSEGGTSEAAFTQDGMSGRIATTAGKGRFEVSLSSAGFLYDLAQEAFSASGEIPMIPGTVEGSVGSIALRLAVPVSSGPAAQPYVASARVADLVLSDSVWDLFDPGRALPRTPARLTIDVSGLTRVAPNAFAEDGSAPEMPFIPESLDVTAAEIAFGGAEAKASGALTFRTDGPVPVPVGRIEGTIKGAYALIQTLAGMGAPPEAIMGARGVLSVIGKPVGPDSLTSSVEFRDDGSIWANGARVPMP